MITFIWLTFEPVLPMIPSFNKMSYFRDMETNIKNILDNATNRELQEILEHIVLRDLSACGYFMSDCEPEWLMKRNNPDWKPYSSKSFGEMLLDFACQWNMEHEGKNYEYKLKED